MSSSFLLIPPCQICGEQVTTKHPWEIHKIKIKDYYEKYHPKYDLFSHEQLSFKNQENYFLTDFISRVNLRMYLDGLKTKEEKWAFCKELLLKRKEKKNLKYALSTFEAKSLIIPAPIYFEKEFGAGSYNRINTEVGLINRYNYNRQLEFDDNKELNYICDTREQNILKIPKFKVKKLNYGDYSIMENNEIYIEKKSLSDAISTLSKGYNRFTQEIERCKNDNNYLIILIIEKYDKLLSFPFLPYMKYTRCSFDYIFFRIRDLIQRYPLNIQFLCSDGKREAIKLVDKIFKYKGDIKEIDLQYYYNCQYL